VGARRTGIAAARAASEHGSPPEGSGHRERLIAAMAQSIEEKGYRETFVADVVRIARTSRRNYYEHFKDRDGCYLALFDAANAGLIEQITAAVRPERPWDEQVDSALGAYLDSLAGRPALWQSFTRELPALGHAGVARQRAAIERFAELLVTLVESGRRAQPDVAVNPLTRDIAIVVVGGLRELVVSASEQGRDVRELRPIAAQAIKAILNATVLQA
jgi:AcrR family transcriptional regulator